MGRVHRRCDLCRTEINYGEEVGKWCSEYCRYSSTYLKRDLAGNLVMKSQELWEAFYRDWNRDWEIKSEDIPRCPYFIRDDLIIHRKTQRDEEGYKTLLSKLRSKNKGSYPKAITSKSNRTGRRLCASSLPRGREVRSPKRKWGAGIAGRTFERAGELDLLRGYGQHSVSLHEPSHLLQETEWCLVLGSDSKARWYKAMEKGPGMDKGQDSPQVLRIGLAEDRGGA